jgi:glycosyltransferase involved in cell wall biosynthesis
VTAPANSSAALPRSVVWVNQFALLPRDGGGTRHFELGRELVRLGWRVTVLASDLHLHRRTYTRRAQSTDRAVIAEACDGVDFKWLWAAAYERNDWRRAWNWLSFGRSVKAICRELERPSVVIGSSPQLLAAHAARIAARRLRVPFVFEVRDLWPESLLAAGGKRGPAYHVLDRIAWSLYREADRILVLARGTREYLVEHGIAPEKVTLVPNGVDIHAIVPTANGTGRAPGAARRFVFVYAGAHGPANGLDKVLEAAESLGPSSGAHFVLIGDGPAKKALIEQARARRLENVEFRDPVAKTALVDVLGAADAGLMILRDAPLFSFGVSPNKLFDYLAAGLPVVCNVPGEVAQMLGEARAGVQATHTSGAALATAIRAMMDMPEIERKQAGNRGREWVMREHSREVLGARLDRFLRELI